MRSRFGLTLTVVYTALLSGQASAQRQQPPIRPLGPVVRVSAPGLLSSVASIRTLPGGRVMVNDIIGRRIVVLDSMLTHATTVIDSGSATGGAYGARVGGLLPFRGDSTLFADPASLSMLVIDPQGKVARVMAAPRPNDMAYLIGGPFGTPGFDRQGRLIYRGAQQPGPMQLSDGPTQMPALPDSAPIVRVDLATRKLDTVALYRVMKVSGTMMRAANGMFSMSMRINPMQMLDDWAVMPDGAIAVVRGSDYHVDWVNADGTRTSSPKIPFAWQRMTDSARTAYIDSIKVAMEKSIAAVRKQTGNASLAPSINIVAADSLPDYRPAFGPGAVHADGDGNLWIRTSTIVAGSAVYDVADRHGLLIDRVQVPHSRVIAGFASGGIVYMGVLDAAGARLEEARVR